MPTPCRPSPPSASSKPPPGYLSFTRAAEELGMTQAAVSYQIKLLEERLGAPLFLRRPREVALTEAGAAAGAADQRGLRPAARDLRPVRASEEQATLIVNTMHTFAAQWLAPRLGVFQLRHPRDRGAARNDQSRSSTSPARRSTSWCGPARANGRASSRTS